MNLTDICQAGKILPAGVSLEIWERYFNNGGIFMTVYDFEFVIFAVFVISMAAWKTSKGFIILGIFNIVWWLWLSFWHFLGEQNLLFGILALLYLFAGISILSRKRMAVNICLALMLPMTFLCSISLVGLSSADMPSYFYTPISVVYRMIVSGCVLPYALNLVGVYFWLFRVSSG